MELMLFVIFVVGVLWWRSNRKGDEASAPAPRQATSRRSSASAGHRDTSGAVRTIAVRDSEAAWIPLGHTVNVGGFTLPGGVYVGRSLPALNRSGPDPALIDPKLTVDRRRPDVTGASMGYWPSYSQISPQARAAYLSWLAAERPGGAYIGYVFLWFYGVERRVLVDATHSEAAAGEAPALVSEVERLLALYGDNNSFRRYATNFLGAARLIVGSSDPEGIVPPKQRVGWDFPVDLKVGLGRLVAEGRPLPPEWALAWVVCHPEVRLRTAATRCTDEFAELFTIRYRERFGDGLKVRRNKSVLEVQYYPASASFSGSVQLGVPELPDVTKLLAPLQQLLPIAEAVTDQLDAYSRHLGRGGKRGTLVAQTLLPAALVTDGPARSFLDRLTRRLDGGTAATVDTADILADWPSTTAGTLTKKEAASLAAFLSSAGIGIEPDVRHDGTNLSRATKAVLFHLQAEADHQPSARFTAATAVMRVAAAVATANGTVTDDEERHLEGHLESSLHLDEPERVRLRAHLQWLLAERPSLGGTKKRLEALPEGQRHQLGRFLIGVASADGHIHRDELNVLAKLYPMLGLDVDSLYADVHALAAPGSGDRPFTVLEAEQAPVHAIPPPAPSPAGPAEAIALAVDKVEAIMADTAAVAAALGAVFDEPDFEGEAEADLAEEREDEPGDTIAGLDEQHSTLLVHLCERPAWARSEFDELTSRLGLMPAGAIETINVASFAACDEPLLEGDDPIEVNSFAAKELLT